MSFVGKPQTPVGAFRPSMAGKSVSRGRAFRAGIVPARKGEPIPGLARCAAFSSPPHRRRGAPEGLARIVRARGKSKANINVVAQPWLRV